jgi:hypothetical protein
MANIGNLVVTLEANMNRFNQNMDEASRRAEQSMTRMQGAANIAKAAIGGIAVVATVGLLANLVAGSIEAADHLRDMSQKTGIAVEDLNGLGFAAGQAGGNLESMVAAAGKLNKSIADAAGGGKETGAAFKALGIDVKDAEGNLKKADVVMAEVADQFAKYQDGPEKAALALALFGKAGADMIPLLNEGGTAMRENTEYAKKYSGMTKELANMSDEFDDTMGKLTLQQKAFGNILADAVLPAIQAVASELLGAAEDGDAFTASAGAIRTVLETLIAVGADVVFTFKAVGDRIGGAAAGAVALSMLDFDGFRAISEGMDDDLARASDAHEKFIKKMMTRPVAVPVVAKPWWEMGKQNAPVFSATVKTGKAEKAAGKSDEEKALENGAKLVATLKRQEGALGLTGTALLTYNMTLDGASEAQIRAAQASQTTIDAFKAEEDEAKKQEARVKQDAENEQRRVEQNTANVEQIRQGLLSESAALDEAHAHRIEQLQKFHDAKLDNVMQANALMEEENARHEQTQLDLKTSTQESMLGMMSNSTNQLYSMLQQAGKEQSALGRIAFLASKAMAVAQIILNTNVAAAAALALPPIGLGPVAGVPFAMAIKTMGYASAGITAGLAIASAEGGYDIPAGMNPVTQLHEKEMVLPKAQADVIRGMAAGGGKGGGDNVTIINQTTGRIDKVVDQRISPTERALIIQESIQATAAQFADPNSTTSRSMQRNYNVPRSRS